MTTDDQVCEPFDALAAEFTERCRRGEHPSVEQYAREHPEHAREIRELFSVILQVEGVKASAAWSGSLAGCTGGNLDRLGDFRIVRELGRGGMGIVYEAEQTSLARRVAIKVLPGHGLLDARRRERFEREARTAAKLHHTNIVPIFGVGEQDGHHYFVMQYIRGVGLDALFQRLFADSVRRDAEGGHTAPPSARFEFATVARDLLHERTGGAFPAETATASPTNRAPPPPRADRQRARYARHPAVHACLLARAGGDVRPGRRCARLCSQPGRDPS